MKNRHILRSTVRWLKFNLVGAIGIAVQLAVLWVLTAAGIQYMLATALAVEAAVLHNFLWHERFTWADRIVERRTTHSPRWRERIRASAARLVRFNLTTGAVSIGGNLLLMRLLVAGAHVQPMLANLVSIAGCSLVNFMVSDRWVFRTPLRPLAVNTPDREPNRCTTQNWGASYKYETPETSGDHPLFIG